MKSFVCEAQSVTLAIEKAWINSGKPIIFSVKVIDGGRNTFFWWHKKPAKIIFFYELPSSDTGISSDNVSRNNMKAIVPGISTSNRIGNKGSALEKKSYANSRLNSNGRRFSVNTSSNLQKPNEKKFRSRQDSFRQKPATITTSSDSFVWTKDHVWFIKNIVGFLVKTFVSLKCGTILDTSDKSLVKIRIKHRFGMRGNGNADIINSMKIIMVNALSHKFMNVDFSNYKIIITSLD
jgi:hypothetical protein